ncbi:MAG: hypothetical protein QOF17_789 [Solirubrobacteraceae bacterium]|nr:hypothetical protein [Solirubrobacteraceae bacterium]
MSRIAGDLAVAAVAAQRHGVVSARELAAAGLTHHAIAHRVAHGWLQRRHRGVYLVGSAPGPLTAEAAALLACGETTALSHRSAAAIWKLLPPIAGDVDVTASASVRAHAGIRVRRVATLDPRELTRREGLRITTPARTLVDLAATVTRRELEQALNEALVQRLTTLQRLHSHLAGRSRRRGASTLEEVLRQDPRITRSEGERGALRLIRRAQLPAPLTDVRVAGHLCDLFWPGLGLVVEVDSVGFHATPRAFQRDRRRDAELADAGFRVLRITCWEIVHEPEATVARLARATAARPP